MGALEWYIHFSASTELKMFLPIKVAKACDGVVVSQPASLDITKDLLGNFLQVPDN